MKASIGALCDIRWALPEHDIHGTIEEVCFVFGSNVDEVEINEGVIADQIEQGLIDAQRMQTITVWDMSPLEWLAVRAGQTTSNPFVVVTNMDDIEYIYRKESTC